MLFRFGFLFEMCLVGCPPSVNPLKQEADCLKFLIFKFLLSKNSLKKNVVFLSPNLLLLK